MATRCRATECRLAGQSHSRSATMRYIGMLLATGTAGLTVGLVWQINSNYNIRAVFTCWVKAKFHHAILVADRSEAGRRPVADLLAGC